MLIDILNLRVMLKQYQIIQLDVWNCVFGWWCLCCHRIISSESDIVGKLVSFPFQRCPICEDPAIVGWTEEGEVPKKMCQISLPFKNSCGFSPVGSDSTVLCCLGDLWFKSTTNKEQTRRVGLFMFHLLNKIRSLITGFKGLVHQFGDGAVTYSKKTSFSRRPASTCPTTGTLSRLDKGGVLGTDTKSSEKKRDAPDTLQSGLRQSSPGDVQSAHRC